MAAQQPQKKKQSPPDPVKEKLRGKIKRKVEQLESVADVLTGKDIPQGKIGDRIRRQQELDKQYTGATVAKRDKRYKKFDEWLVRQQRINNIRDDEENLVPYVRLRRLTLIERDKKDKKDKGVIL